MPTPYLDINGKVLDASPQNPLPANAYSQTALLIAPGSAAGTVTANGTTGPIDTTDLQTLAVDVNVSAFNGGTSPTITFFLDRLGLDGIWYRVWTGTAISAPGPVSMSFGPGAVVAAPSASAAGSAPAVFTFAARLGWTLAGAPTNVQFSASIVGV